MTGRTVISLMVPLMTAALCLASPASADTYADQRARMVRQVESIAGAVPVGPDRQAIDERVLEAMAEVPRHLFVPGDVRDSAYEDRPLPIGHGQTISQPYIVALMTHLLRPEPDDVIFELGTGSGYQAAVLSALVREVYTVEIVEPLAKAARERLAKLGYDNVTARAGDGYYGWAEHAPFDDIVVTAAASHIPPSLVEQLKPGGRMVIPVGAAFTVQHLMLVEKSTDGEITTELLLPVSFVPLTGGH